MNTNHRFLSLLLLSFCFSITCILAQQESKVGLNESIAHTKVDNFIFKSDNGLYFFEAQPRNTGPIIFTLNGEEMSLNLVNGKSNISKDFIKVNGLNFIEFHDHSKLFRLSDHNESIDHYNIPLWTSIIPPLLAIIIALIFKEVILALFLGIWSGAFILSGFNLGNLGSSFLSVLDTYILGALADKDHLSVIMFSLLIGGMVALISKNGGMQGVVNALSKYANTSKRAQFVTWLMGISIFFDDYANTLIVGNTMRSVTDKFRISREKLAYIVDSTAAPVSAIAFITTWIGAELGYIDDGIAKIGADIDETPYAIFLSSLKYSFYPILTIIFIVILIRSGKDYGPMFKAEKRSLTTGQVSPAGSKSEDEPDMEDLAPLPNSPLKWSHAILPVLTVILITIIGLLNTGFDSLQSELSSLDGSLSSSSWSAIWNDIPLLIDGNNGFFAKLGAIIGSSNSYSALLWSSLLGVVLALLISTLSGTMKLIEASHWMVTGFKTMLPALIILTLAWALAITTDHLHTADFISNALSGSLSPFLLPAVIFILAAFIAFSTGSSWSTMAILYPIAIPTSYAVSQAAGLDPGLTYEILLCVIATVLAASVMGDHCSPISDTTILSSLATDCNHIDHVRTQMPYSLTVGLVSVIGITIAVFLGGGIFVTTIILILCIIVLYLVVKYIGKLQESA